MLFSLFDEIDGYGVFKYLSFIGSYSCQNGIDNIYYEQGQVSHSGKSRRPDKSAPPEIVTEMEIDAVKFIEIPNVQDTSFKEIRKKTQEERNCNNTQDHWIQQQADLEVQRLFTIVVYKGILLAIG